MIGLDSTTRIIDNKIRVGFSYKGDPTDPITGQTYKSYLETITEVSQQILTILDQNPQITCIQFDPKEETSKKQSDQRERAYKRLLFKWKPYGYIVDIPGHLLEFHWPSSNPS